MPELTRGCFFLVTGLVFLITMVFYCWFWPEPAWVLYALNVPTLSIICTCSTCLIFTSIEAVWLLRLMGWAPSCGTSPPSPRLCQQSSSSALCARNCAEDFAPHASASSSSLALDAVSRCRRQPSPTKQLSFEDKGARWKSQGLMQRLCFQSRWFTSSTTCSYNRNTQPYFQNRYSGSS